MPNISASSKLRTLVCLEARVNESGFYGELLTHDIK